MSRRLRLVILSEDTGKHGAETVRVLVRKLLAHELGPNARVIHQQRPEVQWVLPTRPEDALAAGASLWKAKRLTKRDDEDARRHFVQELTEALLTAVTREVPFNVFVFFHHDGDARWSTHPACALCTSFESFVAREIEPSVRWTVDNDGRTKHLPRDDRDALVRRAMARLIPVQPHWSIEAWLYGGSEHAEERCKEKRRGKHPDRPCGDDAFWCATHDEHTQPKDNCCLTDEFNLDLAKRFRAESAVEASPSFGALAEKVRACGDLMSALNAMT